MRRHELLDNLHTLLVPRTYFEIGVSKGVSLSLSRTRTVAVDPFFELTKEVLCDLHLVRSTSDEFFARVRPFAHFNGTKIDLAFIDGMHLAEYALRDVINTLRHAHPGSVIVLDDMLPRNVEEARRALEGTVRTAAWAGDVYKVSKVLQELCPDMICLQVDTEPTGTVVLLAPDTSSKILADAYDGLVEDLVVPDPQTVPEAVLSRAGAIQPEDLLALPIWEGLRAVRALPATKARPQVRSLLADAGLVQSQS